MSAAARHAGVSPRTLVRAEKDGRIAFDRNERGRRTITIAGLENSPILTIGRAASKHMLSYETFRRRFRQMEKANPGMGPGKGVPLRRFLSISQARMIADGIKQKRALRMVAETAQKNNAALLSATGLDPFTIIRKQAKIMVDVGIRTASRRNRFESVIKKAFQKLKAERDAANAKNLADANSLSRALRWAIIGTGSRRRALTREQIREIARDMLSDNPACKPFRPYENEMLADLLLPPRSPASATPPITPAQDTPSSPAAVQPPPPVHPMLRRIRRRQSA